MAFYIGIVTIWNATECNGIKGLEVRILHVLGLYLLFPISLQNTCNFNIPFRCCWIFLESSQKCALAIVYGSRLTSALQIGRLRRGPRGSSAQYYTLLCWGRAPDFNIPFRCCWIFLESSQKCALAIVYGSRLTSALQIGRLRRGPRGSSAQL